MQLGQVASAWSLHEVHPSILHFAKAPWEPGRAQSPPCACLPSLPPLPRSLAASPRSASRLSVPRVRGGPGKGNPHGAGLAGPGRPIRVWAGCEHPCPSPPPALRRSLWLLPYSCHVLLLLLVASRAWLRLQTPPNKPASSSGEGDPVSTSGSIPTREPPSIPRRLLQRDRQPLPTPSLSQCTEGLGEFPPKL